MYLDLQSIRFGKTLLPLSLSHDAAQEYYDIRNG